MSRLTIQVQITLIAGLVGALLVAATAGMAMYLAQNREMIVAEDKMEGLARNMAEALDRGMFERYREIRNLASLDLLQGIWIASPDATQSVIETLQASLSDYAWIGLALPNGKVHAATQGMLEGVDVSERPWFKAGLKADFVGDVHDAKLLANLLRPSPDGEPFRFVDVASPVENAEGEIIGVLGAHLSWSWASDLKRSLITPDLIGTNTDVWIVSPHGEVLLGPRTGQTLFSEARTRAMLRAGSGTFVDTSASEPVFTGYAVADGFREYPGLDWIVLARQPASVAFALARGRVLKIALIGICVAAIGIATFIVIGGRLGHPIQILTEEAHRIGRDPEARMFPRVTGSSETELLSGALRSLLRRIGDAELRTAESEQLRAIEEQRHSEDADQLRRLADTDPLTGLMNRRSFDRAAKQAMEHFRRNARPFAVLVVDIDHFKKVNDTYGHAAGDDVIKHTANMLVSSVRTPDRVARVGGEEFIALLHDVDRADALALAERIRNDIAETPVHRDKGLIKVTISIGVSTALSTDRDVEDVVARADAGLYAAKAEGRNRCVLRQADETAAEEPAQAA